jgi:hypothetical protein
MQEDCPTNSSNESRWKVTLKTWSTHKRNFQGIRELGTLSHITDKTALTAGSHSRGTISHITSYHLNKHTIILHNLTAHSHTPYDTSSDWSPPWRHTLGTLRRLSLQFGSIRGTNCRATKHTSTGTHKINYFQHVRIAVAFQITRNNSERLHRV